MTQYLSVRFYLGLCIVAFGLFKMKELCNRHLQEAFRLMHPTVCRARTLSHLNALS